MTLHAIGDLAMTLQNRLGQTRLKSELQALTGELSTGKLRDPAKALGGDLGPVAGIERQLAALGAYGTAASETGLLADAAIRAIETMQKAGADLGPALLRAGTTGEPALVGAAAADARARFGNVVSALNVRVADRALFAGTATDGPAVAGRDAMLDELAALVSGETTAAGVVTAVETWFDAPGGGFETLGYLGATSDLQPARIGPGREAELTLRADDPALRDLMKGYAMAALVAEGALSGQPAERAALLHEAGLRIMAGDGALAQLGADAGRVAAAAEEAATANAAETSALEIARNELLAADPYETATALSAAETQLQTLYALTARLSRLSLAEYLR